MFYYFNGEGTGGYWQEVTKEEFVDVVVSTLIERWESEDLENHGMLFLRKDDKNCKYKRVLRPDPSAIPLHGDKKAEIVRIWKAPQSAGDRVMYVTVTSTGAMIRCYNKLSDIREFYKESIRLGNVVLIRELDKVYQPKR